MTEGWQAIQAVFRALAEILAAGVAITAFSLFLYAMAFNLRDRVARSFATIVICITAIYTGEAMGSTANLLLDVEFMLRLQWVGMAMLPATYLHFTDALLGTTGENNRAKRSFWIRVVYLVSALWGIGVILGYTVGSLVVDDAPAPHLEPTSLTVAFMLYALTVLCFAGWYFVRAYRRTITPTSRRRMLYLLVGAVGPAFGSFPFLLFSAGFASRHLLVFWVLAVFGNLVVGLSLVLMAYAAAFFGVPWPDRLVKSRLFKWLMRGPFTASLTLAAATLVRRAGEVFGYSYTALVPLVTVVTVLLCEYLITLFAPVGERWLFFGNDRDELTLLKDLENRLLTRNDLKQFLEMVLAAICDRLQVGGAYVAALNQDHLELVVTTGRVALDDADVDEQISDHLLRRVNEEAAADVFRWGTELVIPLIKQDEGRPVELLGLLGINAEQKESLEKDELAALDGLVQRVVMALNNRRLQEQVFQSLQSLTDEVGVVEHVRVTGRIEEPELQEEMVSWVREALTHYWGGPKLTESPLLQLKVVQDALSDHGDNHPNALRAILRKAIDRIRPEGERRFTAEWILYNILEMKFVEGRKVREVALRLAMSEADLYRKQRVAIESVARSILEMEAQAQKADKY